MKPFPYLPTLVMLCTSSISIPSWAVIDADAPVVKLRQSCASGSSTLDNCFTSMDALQNWIDGTRTPTADAPLLVEIGPGQFFQSNGQGFDCNTGYVTLRGAGQNATIIGNYRGDSTFSFDSGIRALNALNCPTLNVENLSAIGTDYGVLWYGGAKAVTTWTNVTVASLNYGWADTIYGSPCAAAVADRPVHYWFSSRIVTDNVDTPESAVARAYTTNCGEHWFWGSEISTHGLAGQTYAFLVQSQAGIHVYGSNVTAEGKVGATFTDALMGITAQAGGEVHIHGSGIDMIANDGNYTMVAISGASSGGVHANGTAYNMVRKSGTGVIRRVLNNGASHVEAPYTWGENPLTSNGTLPPDIKSVTGADMMVEKDCSSTGCQTTGTESHLLVYNSNCTAVSLPDGGPWFDVGLNKCRGQ